jgi:hypothetical protein
MSNYRIPNARFTSSHINDELAKVERDIRGQTWAASDRPTDGRLLSAVVSDDAAGTEHTFFDESTSTWRLSGRTATFAKANLPTDGSRTTAIVSDEVGGATLAFWDGTNWRRAQDLVVVS